MTLMQRAITLIYPDQCALCPTLVDAHGGVCADCWRDTDFVEGHTCDLCANPLMGDADEFSDICDDCQSTTRPWSHGRAALYYAGAGRRLTLALKHGDRTDLAVAAAGWLAHRAADVLHDDTILVPIPAHWRRLLARRYNPAVELARALSHRTGLTMIPDALVRIRATPTQEGRGRDARFENLQGAIAAHPSRVDQVAGRRLCIIDDAMTSGATLSAATRAALQAGAADVSVAVLARALRTP